jgi:hypothetical protein
MHVCSGQNPRAVTFREEDFAGVFDALEDFAIRATANTLCREKSRAAALLCRDLLACLLKPIAAKVRLRAYSITEVLKHRVNVGIA